MTRARALVALAESVALLAGCTAAPELPAPLTKAEAEELIDQQNAAWWNSMFPDEPMPTARVVAYLDPRDPGTAINDCLISADIDGLAVGADGSWNMTKVDAATNELLNRAMFVCSLRFPYDLSDPEDFGMLSDAQRAWIWSYNQNRLVPCLQSLGYVIENRTGDFDARDSYHSDWWPYFDIQPVPQDEGEWARIDLRCPPPPIGQTYRPTVDQLGVG